MRYNRIFDKLIVGIGDFVILSKKFMLTVFFVGLLCTRTQLAHAQQCGMQNPKGCGDFTVCTLATTVQNGKRKWNTGYGYLSFLEAKTVAWAAV